MCLSLSLSLSLRLTRLACLWALSVWLSGLETSRLATYTNNLLIKPCNGYGDNDNKIVWRSTLIAVHACRVISPGQNSNPIAVIPKCDLRIRIRVRANWPRLIARTQRFKRFLSMESSQRQCPQQTPDSSERLFLSHEWMNNWTETELKLKLRPFDICQCSGEAIRLPAYCHTLCTER